jgi:hypothetical protein
MEKLQIAKISLRNKKKLEASFLLISKFINKAIVQKSAWYWHKDRKHRLIEQNMDSRSKSTCMWSTDPQVQCQEYTMRKA